MEASGAAKPGTAEPGTADPGTADPGTAEPAPAQESSGSTVRRRSGSRRAHKRATGGTPAPSGAPGILRVSAAEDDPRAWGDRSEDLGQWLQEQRPPHWD